MKNAIRTIERVGTYYLLKIIFILSTIIPIQERKVVFASMRMTELKENFLMIQKELEKRSETYKYVYLLERFDKSFYGKIKYFFHMMRATYHYATAKYFIIDDYYYPVYVHKRREGTKVVQVWHACGAFKKFGYSVVGKEYGASESYLNLVPIHSNYDYVFVSGREVIPHYHEAFGTPCENIYPLGVPRTDIFFHEEEKEEIRQRVYTMFPQLKGKKVMLFAPTYRGTGQTNSEYNLPMDFEKIAAMLPKDYVFALRMHPFARNQIVIPSHLKHRFIDTSSYPEMNDLLLVTDTLISDYSSVVFEASLLTIPMVFYAPDLEAYIAERDFYYEYKDFVPGPITDDLSEAVSILVNQQYSIEKVEQFAKRFFDQRDGQATARIVDAVFDESVTIDVEEKNQVSM